jgi:hypothetical protein
MAPALEYAVSYSPNTDTIKDNTHTWNNRNDQVEFERAFYTGSVEEQLMAIALHCANPLTPEKEIRQRLTVPGVPSRLGYNRVEPGIGEAFAGYQAPDPHSMMDYSGKSTSVNPEGSNHSQAVW